MCSNKIIELTGGKASVAHDVNAATVSVETNNNAYPVDGYSVDSGFTSDEEKEIRCDVSIANVNVAKDVPLSALRARDGREMIHLAKPLHGGFTATLTVRPNSAAVAGTHNVSLILYSISS